MDTSLLIAAGASFVAGLMGYIIARLWIKPIARYTSTRRKLDRELSRCLAKVNANSRQDIGIGWQKESESALRRARMHAMDLVSFYGEDIPYWYRLLLDSRNETPKEASGLLTNLTKIRDPEIVKNRIGSARKAMGLK